MLIHYKTITLFLINCYIYTNASTKTNSMDNIKKSLEEHQGHLLVNKSKAKSVQLKIENVTKTNYVPTVLNKKLPEKFISPIQVQQWAQELSEKIFKTETQFVRRDVLLKGFSDVKVEVRNGPDIVQKASQALEDLLERRGQAAEAIMRKAEELATTTKPPFINYHFTKSDTVDDPPPVTPEDGKFQLPLNCSRLNKVKLTNSVHFNANVSLDYSSVHVAAEVYECDPRILKHIHWTEGLLSVFRDNYAQDSTIDFQYMCSAKGFLRHYPAALWKDMYKLKTEGEELYDCRLRPWYVSASGAPRDVLILLDSSGSMNSSNRAVAEQFAMTLLSALTDDDQVNVLQFNLVVESPIPCFDKKLVPANHVNSAAMMAALRDDNPKNETVMEEVLRESVKILNRQLKAKDTPNACQQAIVLLTDSLYDKYSELMSDLDPTGSIRLFVMWLHDPQGLRDNTHFFAQAMACERDGYYAELITDSDATEQVMNILRVMERPLVAQRKHRLRVYSDVYANVEDPRRSEFYWQQKENAEQNYRYAELRRNKHVFLTTKQYGDYMHIRLLDEHGQYYEGEDVNFRFQISVSVPVFENTTLENITITLDEEKQRNSTRTYPVNRLLGVAGVDIPIDHLKKVLPYYLVGAGGSISIVDHRGNVVLHENVKPVFDGDILKPGYRTVDFLDVEQSTKDHLPRRYPEDWMRFRKDLILGNPTGHEDIEAKTVYENGMRAILGKKDYYWKRIMDHYTLVVSLPKYNIRHAVLKANFTQKLAEEAYVILKDTEFAVHPEWLYCEHANPSKLPTKEFSSREDIVRHFIDRRRKEPNFTAKKTRYRFLPFTPALRNKTYQCNEELMARLCKEVIATAEWVNKTEEEEEFPLGSVTAFFATESGFTRWMEYRALSSHAFPPDGRLWSNGPTESWFRRAVVAKDTLVIHAPVSPIRVLRNSFIKPPELGTKFEWLTAARTFGRSDHTIGVAGFHFYPEHLKDLLVSITNPNNDCEKDCKPQCDEENWNCVLIDEEGWIVTYVEKKDKENENENINKPIREHLANLHPAAMRALLDAKIFTLHWIHDYQGVCFPAKDEKSSAPMLPSLVQSLWFNIRLLVRASQEAFTLLTILGSSSVVKGETTKEKKKRQNRTRRDYEREKFESLHDDRVLVNRTRFAACDRSRPIYQLNRAKDKMEALRKPPAPCKWPLVGTEVPGTNLLLLAIKAKCEHTGKPLNNPLINAPVPLSELTESEMGRGRHMSTAAKLACLRNRVPMPARTPHTRCFPHNYSQEEGYRQCGPWLPDPEPKDSGSFISPSTFLIGFVIVNCFIPLSK